MFEDYCAAHGRPCIPGSLYCCEECRLEDLETSAAASDSAVGSPICEKGEQLMYECFFCQSYHTPAEGCVGKSYSLVPFSDELDNLQNTLNGQKLSMVYEEEPMFRNNDFIQSNYRKWLLYISPR